MAKSSPKQFMCDVIAFDLTCIWFIRCPSSNSIMVVSQQEVVQFLQCWTEAPRMPGSHVFAGDAMNKFSAPSDRSLTDKLARKHSGSEKPAPMIILSQNQSHLGVSLVVLLNTATWRIKADSLLIF